MHAELLVSRAGDHVWAALRQGGQTVEFRVERRGEPPRFGRVVKARVTSVVPALQAAFVDVGAERDAFVHASDLTLPGERVPANAPIQDRLREGSELLVQISRESFTAKGDRATCFIGLPGRLLVLLPVVPQVGISRRISDLAERERLTGILRELDDGKSGFVARTAADGASASALQAEAERLLETWGAIEGSAETAASPTTLHNEPPLTIRLLRDAPAGGLDRVVLDDAEERDRAVGFLDRVDRALASRIELYEGGKPLLAAEGLDAEIERALRPKVWLACGGYLVIEPTEALVSIDVNTGRSVRSICQEDTSLETNMQAAPEIARQLRLRDLGGIVVVDFVDMRAPEHWERLLDAVNDALCGDPARTKVVDVSELGLMQITRKRTRSGLYAELTQGCPGCYGRGRVLRPEVEPILSRWQRPEN